MLDTAYGAIFDMDGVLVDSSEAHYLAWHRFGEELGKPFARALFDHTFGMTNFEIIPMWLGDALDRDKLPAMSDRKEELYREAARDAVVALDGVPELLESLAADGFKLAIGSSGPRANVEMVLDVLGAHERFAALSTLEDVSNGKPDPEVFLKAAAKLDLPPDRCVVFEDAPQGVAAGRHAGCKVIAVTSTRKAEQLRDAHLIVDTLAGLTAQRVRELIRDG